MNSQLAGQSVSTLMGARQAGMGYASSTPKDEWALFSNVGALGKTQQLSTAFAYEAVPALVGANRMAAVLNVPLRWANAGLGMFRFGDAIYSEQIISLGIGNQFGITSLGAKLNYIQYRAEGFGVQNTVSIDFGGITQLTDQISIGAYINNLTQSSLQTRDGDKLPTRLVVGIGLKPSEKVFISTELEKDIDYKPTWRTGLEYSVYKNLFFRTGYALNPQAGFFGLGFHKNKLKIDYAIRLGQLTGTAHQASATYLIPKKAKK
ncbi:MAG: hypothetical protein ACK47E_14790 [Cyclobacteriaceae bacterium]